MNHCIAEAAAAYGRSTLEPLGETGASTSGNADTWRLSASGSSNLHTSATPLSLTQPGAAVIPAAPVYNDGDMHDLRPADRHAHAFWIFKRKHCYSVDLE